MTDLQWYDGIRILSAIIAIVVMYLSAKRASKLWPSYTMRLRDLWWCMQAFLFSVVVVSIETMKENEGLNVRMFLFLVIPIAMLRGVLRDEGYLVEEPNITLRDQE